MFAFAYVVEFTVEDDMGERRVIHLEDVMARPRADMDLETILPPFLCDTVDGAVVIRWDESDFEC
jgi:hypothetical protein